MLKFITGNNGKLREMSHILSPIKIKQVDIDLHEIQELDTRKIALHKLQEAFKHERGNFFVEDTCTYYQSLKNELPGPFMKWFLQILGPKGLYETSKKLGNTKARMQTTVAYAKNKKQIYFFVGKTNGHIVKPRAMGKYGFGVDSIFAPLGSNKSLSQLKNQGRFELSSRYKAAIKFKQFLMKNEQN